MELDATATEAAGATAGSSVVAPSAADLRALAAAALDHALAGCQLHQPSPPEVAAILAAGPAGPVSN